MTLHQSVLKPHAPARDVFVSEDADILKDIALPGVAATIWRREMSPAFRTWINGLTFEELPRARTVVPFHLVEAAVLSACEIAGLAPCPERDTLASDIGALAIMAGRILGARYVRLRMEAAMSVTCPNFHVDNVPARLLCTYRGSGTEYVTEAGLEDPARYRQVPTGAVGLFRGSQWPSDEACGLLHRSPMPAEGEHARLLLVIDPA